MLGAGGALASAAMGPRLAAVSVDLDEVPHYVDIHALAPITAPDPRAHAVYDRALGRIEGWASALSIPVTFFAVGRDLARPSNAAALRRLRGRGHAIESHSHSHRYDLTRLSPAEIAAEVREGLASVERAAGARPAGFRAPGYTVSEALFDALDEAGVAFDSSVFPSPVYYAAKAAVLAWMRLRGRASASILDAPSVLLAPRTPYRPARPYHRPSPPPEAAGPADTPTAREHEGTRTTREQQASGGRARRFVELPILVTPLLGFPVIGTSVGRAGVAGARALARACAGAPLANLELHGMDFLEAADIAPHPLSALQPELRAPLAARLDRLTTFVRELRARGFTFTTLAEAAAHFGA